jgi:hypothetical protein
VTASTNDGEPEGCPISFAEVSHLVEAQGFPRLTMDSWVWTSDGNQVTLEYNPADNYFPFLIVRKKHGEAQSRPSPPGERGATPQRLADMIVEQLTAVY